VPSSMLRKIDTWYALKAKWDSMNGIGIFDGDYVVIKYQNTVDDWDVGVIIIKDDFDERAVLKQVYKKPNSVLLKPKNERFSSIILWDDKNFEIRGKLIWIISNFN
jgi:repressor LexA